MATQLHPLIVTHLHAYTFVILFVHFPKYMLSNEPENRGYIKSTHLQNTLNASLFSAVLALEVVALIVFWYLMTLGLMVFTNSE